MDRDPDTAEPLSDGALALLAWQAAMGADEAVAEQAIDWANLILPRVPARAPARVPAAMAVPSPPRPSASPARRAAAQRPAPASDDSFDRFAPPHTDDFDPPPPRPSRDGGRAQPTTGASGARAVPPGGDATVRAAREQARTAASLDELEALLRGFEGCGLKATAKNLCFYRGVPKARLMVIGEAPGRDEDLAGKPFVGRAGQLLDRMLAAIDLDESAVHITNVVYWRPPGNRPPTPQESQVCHPFLQRQIELVAPEFVLCVGGSAAKQVLDTPEGIMKLRGKWRPLPSGERTLRAMATLHPAYLLRTPAAKRMAWRDLLLVRAALDELDGEA